MRIQIFTLIFVSAVSYSCMNSDRLSDSKKEEIRNQISLMLDNYHQDIKRNGLTAEFNYLDQSADFFWVPPGYNSALSFDSVKVILEMNAKLFETIEFQWDTLRIFPLSENIANYSGIVKGAMLDKQGMVSSVKIIESGTIIKRNDGWKLLNGQSANLSSKPDQ